MSRRPQLENCETIFARSEASLKASQTSSAASAREDWVDLVRLVAIFLIVLGHVLNLDRRFQDLPVGSIGWIEIDTITVGIRWALPTFVMISGYLLLDSRTNLDWKMYYRRRMQRIGWPLVVWTVFYLGVSICDDLAAGRPIHPMMVTAPLIKGAPYYHLWYLYMLMGLYLICPFVKLATDRMSPNQLIAAVSVCFVVTVFSASVDGLYSVPNATYIDDFPRYLGYFLAGHLLGRVLPPPKFGSAAAVLLVSFLVTAGAAYVVAGMSTPSRALRVFGFGNPTIIGLSLSAFVLIRQIPVAASWGPWIRRAAEASFGIYLVHPAILDVLRHWSYPNALPAFAAEVAMVFLSSLLIVLALQRMPLLHRCV